MDYGQEQEMEIEALQAILMEDIQEFPSEEDGSESRCFSIAICSEDDVDGGSAAPAARVALIFSHTPKYPDEPPRLDVQGLKGVRDSEAKELKEKLQSEALDNLGMAMMYTLVSSAKEWLSEKFGQGSGDASASDEEGTGDLDEVVEPHGELVTVETFVSWRERFEAEMALERAKLMTDSALSGSKEKRLTGRTFFEMKSGKITADASEEEEEEGEDIDFDADYDDGDVDEDDMLEHYLSQKTA